MDKYDIIGTVGEGSYGVVLKSRHRETGQTVAIKKFLETEEDINSRRMALREIRMLKKLRHENLVCLIEVFRTRKYFHLVFEFVDRTILDELEERGEGLGEAISRERIFQVIRAVRYCHSKHIIHRDVKPENVLVSNQGVVKLCDFGFARIMVTPGEPCTEYVATRWYRAPELLVTDVHYGPAVDIWAVGCLYSEMMTGKPLFPGDSDIDQLYKICKILGQPCYRHQQIISRNPAFREMNRNITDDTGRTLLKMYPNWPPIAIDFLAASMKMDPSSRPTSDELMRHNYFTHDRFSEKFLPKLRQKVLQEYQENPLLRKFQTEILSASEERKTDLFFERQQKKSHAEVPRWKINLYDPYNKKKNSYLTLSRTSSDNVNSRTFLNSIDKNATANEKIKTLNHKHVQSFSKLEPKKLDVRHHNQSSENNEFLNKSPLKKKFEEVKSSVNENVDVSYDDKNCDNIKNFVEIHVDGPSPAPFQSLQSDNNRMHYNSQNILHPSINNLTFLNNNNKDIGHQRRASQTLPSNQKIKDLSGTSLRTLQSMFNKSPVPLVNPPREQLIRRIGRGLVLDVNQLGTGHEPVAAAQQGTKTPPAWLNTAGYTTYKKHSVEQTTWTRLEQPGGNGERTLPSLTGNVSPFKNQRKKLQSHTIHPPSENHNNTPRDNSSKSQPPIRHINSNLPYM